MRVQPGIIAATVFGGINVGYKWVKENGNEAATNELGRNILRTGGFIVLLTGLSLIPGLDKVVNVIALIYATIIVLNTGSDILKALGAL